MHIVETASGAANGKPQEPADITRKQRWFRAYETNKAREMSEQRTARQYYHDRQWTDEEVERLKKRGQQATVRNRIKRKIDFLVGVEQRLRRDPKAYPRTPRSEHDADTATAALRFACDMNRWEKISSDVMHDGLVNGMGVVFVGIERQDPKLRYVPADRFFYDPRSTLADFSDARYLGLYMWMDVDDASARWPDKAERLEAMVDATNVAASIQQDADREQQWGDFQHRRVRVVEFWEKRRREDGSEGWWYCYFTGELDLESEWSPYIGEHQEPDLPYIAWSPYIDERGDRYGLVRTMKSIQDEINYAASKILHRISTDRTFGEEGAVDDVDDFKRQMARPDGHATLLRGEWGKSVGIIDSGVKIQGETERFQLAVTEIENLGPNPGLVGKGQGVDGASGRALLAQRDSGMTELSPIFERHREWKLRVYRALWQRCRQAWQGEKWIRITDDSDSVKFVGLNQFQMAQHPVTGLPTIAGQNVVSQMDVDIILNEGPDTITMNEELMQTLSQLGEAAMSGLGKVMIELSNAPNKERLLKLIEEAGAPDPMVAQMQQRMAQLEAMVKASTVDMNRANVENKRADTLSKLIAAATPQQQETDEFGNPSGPPPAAPNLGAAFQAMQMFPLQFSQPLAEDIAAQPPAPPQPPQPEQGGPQPGAGPQAPQMPPPVQPGLNSPAQNQMMTEQMAGPGSLPVNQGA